MHTITGGNGTSGFSFGGDGSDTNVAFMVVEEAASVVVSLPYNFFRTTGQSFGDIRLENVYAGSVLDGGAVLVLVSYRS